MMTFQYRHYAEPDRLVTLSISEDSTLDKVLEAFENFLRGAGYSVEMQSLEIVERTTAEAKEPEGCCGTGTCCREVRDQSGQRDQGLE